MIRALFAGLFLSLSLACSGSSPSAGAGNEKAAVAGSEPSKSPDKATAQDPPPLRFSGIPDSDKDKLAQLYAAVSEHLTRALHRKVEYVHVPDYTAAVTALAANKVDFVWLGGVTAVQAEQRTGGEVTFMATRAADLRFKSYFVANRKHIESGKFRASPEDHKSMPLGELAGYKPTFADLSFTFGSKSSTSGHIMPRHFMQHQDVDIHPERDFGSPAAYQLKGGHNATLHAVASGAADVGALNFVTWEKADAKTKANAPIIYVTPEYVDYVLVAHNRIGEATIDAIGGAFVGLDPGKPDEARVLEAFGAKKFVSADPRAWDGIRSVVKELTAKGTLH